MGKAVRTSNTMMDPLTLFAIAAAATIALVVLGSSILMGINYILRRRQAALDIHEA